ncbi:MAG: hypothetical protein KAI24_24720 [Planctomycetes bacterium]|nr:hypothetical protein [Planctomycetota bacterium]
MRKRHLKTALLGSLLGLTACGSANYSRVVSINPPEASLYINGEKVGNGDKRERSFSFARHKRHYIQAVHPDFIPKLEIVDEKTLQGLVKNNLQFKMTMKAR